MVLPYTQVVAGSSTNVTTPTTEEFNQGNNQLTPYNSAINNGYYRQISQGVANLNAEIINAITGLGGSPNSSNNNLIDALLPFLFPVGSTIDHAAITPPAGYLICDGSEISRTTYSALFAVIGTTWGAGNGSTTFNIPDLRGYFKRGWAGSSSVDSGRVFASTQNDDFKLHGHPFRLDTEIDARADTTGGMMLNSNTASSAVAFTGSPSDTAGEQIGGSGGSETRPINKAILICIKF